MREKYGDHHQHRQRRSKVSYHTQGLSLRRFIIKQKQMESGQQIRGEERDEMGKETMMKVGRFLFWSSFDLACAKGGKR